MIFVLVKCPTKNTVLLLQVVLTLEIKEISVKRFSYLSLEFDDMFDMYVGRLFFNTQTRVENKEIDS